jgi:AsmA protein
MRALKIAGVVIAGVIGIFIIAAAALVMLFDPNDYKGVAASYVEQRTGRTLTVDEELSLDFFPWLALEAGGITVGNAPGFEPEPFARIVSVAARVKLLPLFSGTVEIGRIDIDGIELNLARDEQLRGNWEDLANLASDTPAAAAEAAEAGDQADGSPAALGDFEIEGITIRNGTVNWREGGPNPLLVLSGLEFESSAIRRDEPVEAEVAFHLLDAASQVALEMSSRGTVELGDETIAARDFSTEFRVVGPSGEERTVGTASLAGLRVAGDVVELTGANANGRITTATWPEGEEFSLAWESMRYDGAAQTLAFAGLETKSGAAAATWQITGENLAAAPHLAGSVRVSSDSLGDLLRLAAVATPEGVDPAKLGSLELTATFDMLPNDLKLSLAEIDARALGTRLTGAAEIDASVLTARIAVPRFMPADELYAVLASVLPDTIDARELGELAFSGALETNLESGRLSIRNMTAELLGGSVAGELTMAPAEAGSSLSGMLKTSRFPSSAVAGLLASYLPENIDADEVGVLAIDARFDYDAGADRATLGPFAVEAFGLNAAGNATVTAASTRPRVVGDVRLAEFAPRAVLARFGQPVPQTSDPSALSRATVATRFTVDAENGSFENLTVKLDESTITGSFAVANFADPSYRFDLSADRIDVDRYVPPPAEQVEQGERAAGDIALEAEPLNAIRIDGQARVGDLKITNLRFQDVATHLAIGGGKATIDSASAKLYGGTFEGGLFVDATGQTPTMTLRGRAAELQLTPLIEALTGDANVSGTGSFDIDLTGRGPTVTDNLRSAAGSMGFALRDGALEGFNLGHVLCIAYNKLQQLPEPPDQPKLTQFQLIQADAAVANGVATSPEMLARAAFVDVTGSGTLVLADGILDYGMRATFTNPIAIPNCNSMDRLIGGSIPFTIKGPVTAAVILPDFGQIIQERVRDELQDRLRERLLERLRQ